MNRRHANKIEVLQKIDNNKVAHEGRAGMPESFNVLVKEIRSLGIDIDLNRS